MFLRNKRGVESSIWWLMDLFFLVVITFFLLKYVGKVGDTTTFQKRFLAEDMSLLIDTLYAVPGNVYINYPQTTLWFGIQFSKNTVEVFEEENEARGFRGRGDFIEDKRTKFQYGTYKPKDKFVKKENFFEKYLPIFVLLSESQKIEKNQTLNLTFIKKDNELEVVNNQPFPNLNNLYCQNTSNLQLIFVIDNNNGNFYNSAGNLFDELGSTVEKNDLISMNIRGKVLLYLKLNEKASFNYIKSYYDAELDIASGISCSLANELSNLYNTEVVATIPWNKASLIDKSGISSSNILILEIGKNGAFSNKELENIRTAIYSAVKR